MLAEPLARTCYLDLTLTKRDNRRDVEDWLLAHPGVLEHALIDSPTAAGFVKPLPAEAMWVTPSRLAREQPAALLGANTRYVVLSDVAMFPEFAALYRLCQQRGRLVFQSNPYRRDDLIPQADDVYAPYNNVFAWNRPGMLVRIYSLEDSPQ
jgi:hypothetical protein